VSLDIKCDKCKRDLDKPGALLFSPPRNEKEVDKFHICVECYDKIVRAVASGRI